MHELAVCQALLEQVEDVAASNNAVRVTAIEVGIGPLSGVEARLLANAYTVASAGSIAEDAAFVIESLPVRVRCTSCGEESAATPNKLSCASCGDWRTTLVSGDEMLLMSVELDRQVNNEKSGVEYV